MKFIFSLSGDYLKLAKEEAVSLLDMTNARIAGSILVGDVDEGFPDNNFRRLALTKSCCRLLFKCRIADLEDCMKKFGWNSVYKGSFCVRVHDLGRKQNMENKNPKKMTLSGSRPLAAISEKRLAKYIWRSVKNPKVNLENPKTRIDIFIHGNEVYCGLLLHENNEDFESRKSHLRPFPSPSSLHPKLARALVNLTGVKEGEILLDPFCGTGGFLIEAGMMGIKCVGYDIYNTLVKGCRKNLMHFRIKGYKLRGRNALDIDDKFGYAVTDLPYGLNSNVLVEYKGDWKSRRINKKIQQEGFVKRLEAFYLKFLKVLRKKLRKKAVIVFPSYVDYRKLLKKAGFKVEKEFSDYVHRSLTRKMVRVG